VIASLLRLHDVGVGGYFSLNFDWLKGYFVSEAAKIGHNANKDYQAHGD
jgi:hypothetical protein